MPEPQDRLTAIPAPGSGVTGSPGVWTVRGAIRAMLRPEIYKMVLLVYLPVLIPFTVGMVYLGRHMDSLLGWGPLPGWPVNVILFAVLTLAGLLVVWWCYSYIVIVGGGGPAPLVARGASRLVIAGPYGLTRHPSVVGKLLGVLGLGFLMRSPFFVLVVLPVLLVGSLFEKRFFMERRELRYWGPIYRDYIEHVPFFIPRLSDLLRVMRGQGPAWSPAIPLLAGPGGATPPVATDRPGEPDGAGR